MTELEWREFLQGFSRELLSGPKIFSQVPSEVVKSAWMGFPGAMGHAISGLDARIGMPLPPSYRIF